MEILGSIVLVVHLAGFAALFGAWLVEIVNRRTNVTRLMQWGLVVTLVAGLALAAPWGIHHELDYAKIGVKLVILVVIGALLGIIGARQRRGARVAAPLFWAIGVLTLGNAALAVIW
ncbi:Fe-S protein [Microbacterium betulae]|uniref:Fe-S protein n=1 Tax=Microbacterium betulae TaxID=2981139 RepID=A0AA97FJ90_9MICO|nr:Fe-S protein [Microbacterium sp. AB]WOF23763.1 Fe-S protein [Microbacterium sp. AB]